MERLSNDSELKVTVAVYAGTYFLASVPWGTEEAKFLDVIQEAVNQHEAAGVAIDPGEMVRLVSVFSRIDLGYIGDPQLALNLRARGITKIQRRRADHKTCTVGYCEGEKSWYGWGRAIAGFRIGSIVRRGDSAYKPNTVEELEEKIHRDFHLAESEYTTIGRADGTVTVRNYHDRDWLITFHTGNGEWRARTLQDAYVMACDFADGVGG